MSKRHILSLSFRQLWFHVKSVRQKNSVIPTLCYCVNWVHFGQNSRFFKFLFFISLRLQNPFPCWAQRPSSNVKTRIVVTVWKSSKCDHAKKISWNQLFSNFFSTNNDFTEKMLIFSLSIVILFYSTFPHCDCGTYPNTALNQGRHS